jgi:integrase/recombinase XerD
LLTKTNAEAFVGNQLAAGLSAKTVSGHLCALRRIADWLVREGEIDGDPVLAVQPPKLDKKVIEPLSDDELRALLAAGKGKGGKMVTRQWI